MRDRQEGESGERKRGGYRGENCMSRTEAWRDSR